MLGQLKDKNAQGEGNGEKHDRDDREKRDDQDGRDGKIPADAPKPIQIYVQVEGSPQMQLVEVPSNARLQEVLAAIAAKGIPVADDAVLFLEDEENELPRSARLNELGIGHRRRLHCHRCHKIRVSVTYNVTESRAFPPSTTIDRLKQWAEKSFEKAGYDVTEMALQLAGTAEQPEGEVHLGTLVRHPQCEVAFNFTGKPLVQG